MNFLEFKEKIRKEQDCIVNRITDVIANANVFINLVRNLSVEFIS